MTMAWVGKQASGKATRRRLYAACAALLLLATACGKSSKSGGGTTSSGSSSAKAIKIGVVVPLTGPYAELGEMQKLGAQMAVDDLNAAGGIKALGGAKLVLDVRDAGAQVSDSVSAVTALLSPGDVTAGIGAGLSSNSLAITEVSERNKVPWVDLGFADNLTTRGFKYIFITSPTTTALNDATYPAVVDMAKAANVSLKRVGLLLAPQAVVVQAAADVAKIYAPKYGWQIVFNETVAAGSVTGAAATALVNKMIAAKPQLMLLGTTVPDQIQIQKLQIAQNLTPIPWVLSGAPYGSKSFVDALGAKGSQGVMYEGSAAQYPSNNALSERITKAGQVSQEYNLIAYAEIYLIADALERAKSSDRDKLRDAIAASDIKGGPIGATFPCNCLKFGPDGRTTTSEPVIVQWQDGKAVTVYPPSVAQAKAYFPAG
jgi:branched-chain amino acid transport system substrate-binding protein